MAYSKCSLSVPFGGFISLIIAMLLLGSCRLATPPAPSQPIICITFDDNNIGIYTEALPIMNQYGFRATCFVNSGYIGNTYMLSLAQLQNLYEQWNWEIGGHTFGHESLPNISYPEAETAIGADYLRLKQWGLNPKSFALPRGACPLDYYPIISTYYDIIRGSHDFAMCSPLDSHSLGYLPFQGDWDTSVIKTRISRGIANGESLIIIGFHSVGNAGNSYNATCSAAQFAQIMADIHQFGLEVMPLSEAIDKLK